MDFARRVGSLIRPGFWWSPGRLDLGRMAPPERGMSTARGVEELDVAWIALASSIRLFQRVRLSSSNCAVH